MRDHPSTRSRDAGRLILVLAVVAGVAASVGAFTGVYSLISVVGEQDRGRERDMAITAALGQIQDSRKQGIRVLCRSQRQQNTVILGILELSYARARAEGRFDPETVRETRRLTDPLEPRQARIVCRSLVDNIEAAPPPPPKR